MHEIGPERSPLSPARGVMFAITVGVVAVTVALSPPAAVARGGHERLDRAERAIIRMVNHHRARAGLPGLRRSRALNRAADQHTWEMLRRNYFAHASANGTAATSRVRRYRRARMTGETIGWLTSNTRRKARRIVRMWMASPGHRVTLMTRGFRRIGVARRTGRWGAGRVTVFTLDLQTRR